MKASNLRAYNQRSILRHLQTHKHASKAGIAESCSLSKPTAGKIIDELIAADVLKNVDAEEQEAAIGRPNQYIGLHDSSARFALIELGVNKTSIRLVAVNGNALIEQDFDTAANAEDFINQCVLFFQKHTTTSLWAAAIAMPGVVDERRHVVLKSPNISWTEQTHWFDLLQETLQCPVCMVQEIRVLALSYLHTVENSGNFLYVNNDDGLGGALVINNALFTGNGALSAEIGHTPIAGNKRQCGCGNIGCLETMMAIPGLAQSLQVAPQDVLPYLHQHPDAIHTELEHLAQHIASAVNICGVQEIILGASLAEFPRATQQFLEQAIQSSCMWNQFGDISIAYSQVSFQTGLVAYLFEHYLAATADWTAPCQIQHKI